MVSQIFPLWTCAHIINDWIVSQKNLLCNLTRHWKVRLAGLSLPSYPSWNIASFQLTQDHWRKIMQRGPVITLSSPVSIMGSILSGSTDLCASSLNSYTCSSSGSAGSSSSPQSWSSNTGLLGSQDPALVLKTEAKKALNTSALSVSLFVRWLTPSINRPVFSLILCLLLIYFEKPFFPSKCWPAWSLVKLWLLKFSPAVPNRISLVLLFLLPVSVQFLFA